MAEYVNAPAWRNLLKEVWDANQNVSGAIALVSLLSQQALQASTMRSVVAGNYFTTRGLGDWDSRFNALLSRLTFYTAEIERVAHGEYGEPLAQLVGWVVDPILDGMFIKGGEQIKMSFGDAVEYAMLWNMAATAKITKEGLNASTVLPEFVTNWFSQVAHDLERSAPGEDPTNADAVIEAAEKVKDKVVNDIVIPGLEALGTLVKIVGVGFGIVVAIKLFSLFSKKK
jgi:hypothetical protein